MNTTDGETWHNLSNWTVDGVPPESYPTTADTIALGGKTLHITEAAAASAWSGGGTVNVDSGGVLTSNNARNVTLFNVNDGGTINFPQWMQFRSNTTIHAGGTATGGHYIAESGGGRLLTVDGTWSPRGTSSTSLTFTLGGTGTQPNGKVRMGATGTIILDVFGNGSNEQFVVNGLGTGTELTINTGTIELRPQDDYVPQENDAFTLWSLTDPASTALMNIGNGNNIVMPGLGAGLSLDVSQFESSGLISVIPEPTTLGLLAVGALLALTRRRKTA